MKGHRRGLYNSDGTDRCPPRASRTRTLLHAAARTLSFSMSNDKSQESRWTPCGGGEEAEARGTIRPVGNTGAVIVLVILSTRI